MLRHQYLFLLIVMTVGLCFIYATNSYIDISFFSGEYVSLVQRRSGKAKGIINTEGCTIPDLDPMDPSVKNFVHYPDDVPKCSNATLALLDRNRTTIWVREENFDHYNITIADKLTCCYRAFYRPLSVDNILDWNVDNRVKYDDCILFSDAIEVDNKHEFVRVNCSVHDEHVYEQFYLFAPIKEFKKHGEMDEIKNKTGYNVLVVGVDSVSRLNLLRTMPKTVKYLQSKGAIDMLGYNKVGYNTFPNLMPMLVGVKEEEVNKVCYPNSKATLDNCPFVWEWYKQAGYYTAFAEDWTLYSTFNYLKRGFMVAPTDYYPRTFFKQSEKYFGTKMCKNDIYYYQVILDYMEDIIFRLQEKRLFGLFWENTMSHDYLNWPMMMDEDYVKTFTNLELSGYLEESIVFFVSDHGMRWGSIRSTKQGHLEELLPFLYVLTPSSFQKKYVTAYNNLKLNGHRLTTPFDAYETLMDLIDLTNVEDATISQRCNQSYSLKRGISLFLPIPGNRTCKAADISDQWCTCKREVPLDTNHPKAIEAAHNVVNMINFKLEAQSLCAKVELSQVLEVTEIKVGEQNEDNPWREFMVVVKVSPSDAVFEGMLRFQVKKQTWELTGPPSRLNQYGEQGWCIDEHSLKPYCYCK